MLAGLGRDLPSTGRLSPAGVVSARAALRRFKAVLDAVQPSAVFTAATAAVREAEDGAAFIRDVKHDTGLNVRVLAGEEEGRFSALGVAAGAPHATGVAGDLGGFSLELVRMQDSRPGLTATLPLGPFAFGSGRGFDLDAVRKEAGKRLAPVAADFAADTFYAVGGAWRNLALLHMRLADYPLQILHQYELSAAEALRASRFIASQSKGSLERIEGLSRKRVESIPYAAVVLETLIERLGLRRIIVSAWGLREGLLFDSLSDGVKARDPLIEGCAALGARQPQAELLARRCRPGSSPCSRGWTRCSTRDATPCSSPPPAAWPSSARPCTPTTAPTWCSTRCCARPSPGWTIRSGRSWPPPPLPGTPPPTLSATP